MPLESIDRLMQRCREGGYAIGYFESWNLESLQGVLDAAEQTRSPVIVGFNGDFLTHSGRRIVERLELYAALGKAAAESTRVPCGLIFNECPEDTWVLTAVGAGFNLVTLVNGPSSLDDYLQRTKRIVHHAHRLHVAVEAELGELPCGSTGRVENGGSLTDPAFAGRFVEETQVDLLAVSVGNVHIQINGERDLDLDRLADIRRHVKIPLVLHGGTGISLSSLREAIRLGVAKVNFGTYLKQRCLEAMRTALSQDCRNPHELLGIGGAEDAMVACRQAMRDAVIERIGALGCCGTA